MLTLGLLTVAGPASAYWDSDGSGSGSVATAALAPPTDVAVPPTSGSAVLVDWVASGGAVVPTGYFVTRDSGSAIEAACSTNATTLIPDTSCTDLGVPDGTYTYSVTAVYRSWTATGAASGPVVVSDASIFLGAAAGYSVLGGTGVVSTGNTIISGDVGVSPSSSITGFPPGIVGGDIDAGNVDAANGQSALDVAYAEAVSRTPDSEFSGDLNGVTFTAGVHHTGAALALTGTMTLDAAGDPNAVFIFQVDGALNTAAGSAVVLINGAQASNVFWQVNGAAGTGANSSFSGTILAVGAITLGADSMLIGRALAKGTVTLAGNTITG